MHYLGKKEKIGEWEEYDQSTYVIINLLFCTLKARIENHVEKKKDPREVLAFASSPGPTDIPCYCSRK